MTNPPNIDAIIAELSEATGPSRELDARIALANGYECPRTGNTLAQMMSWAPSNTIKEIARWSELPTTTFVLPRYTASLDAAMTLAEGFGGQITFYRDGGAKAFLWQPYPIAVESRGATPAIALCIVSLRVRSALIGEVGRDG